MDLNALQLRDALMRRIRTFFQSEGFIEVETPIRLKTPCMELHIDAEPSGDRFLRTSPELCHKKLLAQGAEKIFEIGKCFRQGERGDLHHPEYTMLEWYRAGGDCDTMLTDTKALLKKVCCDFPGGLAAVADCRSEVVPPLIPSCGGVPEGRGGFSNARTPSHGSIDLISKPWNVLCVEEVFDKFAGWNPVEHFDADRFDRDLIEKIEPNLPRDVPVILKDYPADCCALARLKPDNPSVAERWELYLDGVEIANAYSELTDPDEQRERFERWAAQRQALGKPVYALDEEFINCLNTLPPSGGCALGIDRLLMILTGARTLDRVLAFRD
jgi:elongation factor P--(R)-beta-lysine ligase